MRATEGSPSSCCGRKMKEDEARERNENTGVVIAIDLSAISVNASHEHLRGGGRKEGNKWQENKTPNQEVGVELVHLSEAWVHLRDCNNLIEGLCCILPAVVRTTLNFFINLWHAERIGVGGSGVGEVGAFHFKYIEGISLFKASTSRLWGYFYWWQCCIYLLSNR